MGKTNIWFQFYWFYPEKMLRRASLDDLEQSTCDLAPQLEHRIVMIQNEEVG